MPNHKQHSVLFDTSFFIRLLNDADPLHRNAVGYFKYFAEHGYCLKISTIAIAEFCVAGELTDLPMRCLQTVSFNYNHAERAGKFTKLVFKERETTNNELPRKVVPNDSKMFAQADVEPDIEYFVSSDSKAKKIIELLNKNTKLNFKFVDINIPHTSVFGELDFQE